VKFGEKLEKAMQELNLNQKQVCGITGCSRGSVSQYLSGMNVPTEEKREAIALSLGLPQDYFEQEETVIKLSKKDLAQRKVKRLLPQDVATLLGMGRDTVAKGLQQGVFPWGYGIKTGEKKWTYFINAKRFAEIEGVAL